MCLCSAGFVKFFDPSKNDEYIAKIDGANFLGRNLRASRPYARAPEKDGATSVYVSGLPEAVEGRVEPEGFLDAFEATFGTRPVSLKIHRKHVTGRTSGTGHFELVDTTTVFQVINAVNEGVELRVGGAKLDIRPARGRRQRDNLNAPERDFMRHRRRRNVDDEVDMRYSAGVPAGDVRSY